LGKSTVAANLAAGLALEGKRVGLLDVDGTARAFPGCSSSRASSRASGDMMLLVELSWNLKVMSLGFLLPTRTRRSSGAAGQGRGHQAVPRERGLGGPGLPGGGLPSGTGDEPLSVMQLLGTKAKALIVTRRRPWPWTTCAVP
jgi:Mrp family chromosome partitioning ATPase